ncbi:helix-turn-helix domain-containing protein [Paenibacillus piscarius]|uniref:helix-turn-helix domain-containing protein n=1 Tax=Paenibacillus piscarius TaxID=1089681 RepID=UPI001EE84DC7|nr:helix-turn-helix domain-containing protein [Paenibacillus piscarius]
MEEDLYLLVSLAQKGDQRALERILEIFSPLLNKQKNIVDLNDQDDLLQTLRELIIEKTLNFDIEHSPDFSHFKPNGEIKYGKK